ncbi:sensor histidine kinase [Microbacterium sp. X-17]|uniref:sensor histidine kinase n=1 Tax=Microbacterium sp. X-17 TaxID=3144404 RepID=UPI0031F52037
MDEERAAPPAPEFAGPGWPVLWAGAAPPRYPSRLAVLGARGSRSWYVGGGISLVWLVSVAQAMVAVSPTALQAGIGIALVVVFGAAFLLAGPTAWMLAGTRRLIVPALLFALSFALFPWLGWHLSTIWTYVGVIVGMCVLAWGVTAAIILGLGLLATLTAGITEGWSEGILWIPLIIVSISLMMAGFGRTLAAMNELRATQRQLELMAVERERGRVARDIHDILGHSLTVITVKAELAGRLAEVDPARAQREIAEVESLARAALADVRATVAAVRGVTVSGELAAARVALEAAGIASELPGSTEAVSSERRELAGWVLREGVTNVVRHSGASVCRIRLTAHEVEVADDGVGPRETPHGSSGLLGLRERVEAVGGRLTIGRSDLGGFSLRASM